MKLSNLCGHLLKSYKHKSFFFFISSERQVLQGEIIFVILLLSCKANADVYLSKIPYMKSFEAWPDYKDDKAYMF